MRTQYDISASIRGISSSRLSVRASSIVRRLKTACGHLIGRPQCAAPRFRQSDTPPATTLHFGVHRSYPSVGPSGLEGPKEPLQGGSVAEDDGLSRPHGVAEITPGEHQALQDAHITGDGGHRVVDLASLDAQPPIADLGVKGVLPQA
ncbi:hypothetical protein [Nonomuraea rubra]|uniref:Uncharacterized protein n=1 Tax=Nonomuraea rubra TaxID=46180 RepID=A0A7X0NWD1_9ACTN|nr:hypothetical protein [Nonomuraea rubra]MBB6550820.1 hypothetical protein [Nonomuraea rubra]